MAGVFSEWQPRYEEAGIATFPVKEKRPAVRNYLGAGMSASRQFATKFPNAEALGFSCENSGLTIVDVDSPDERLLRDALDEFGPTPIIVQSGSGNFQAWYKRTNEGRKIRPDPERPIDILGGGFVVAPPSLGSKTRYRFISGSLDDLGRLKPLIRPAAPAPMAASVVNLDGVIAVGQRNESLWREVMQEARSVSTADELLNKAIALNKNLFTEPLPESEVKRITESAWQKSEAGQNWIGKGWRVDVPVNLIDNLMHENPDAFILLMKLQRHHWEKGRRFVVANAMRETMPNGGWTVKRFAAARTYLEQIGILNMFRPANRFDGPAVYQFKGGQF